MFIASCLVYALVVLIGTSSSENTTSYGFSTNVSVGLFAELEELSRLVGISYCVGNQGISKPFDCLNRCDDFKGFTLVETWSLGILDPSSCGYIALSHPPNAKRIIVAFRGSNSLSDAMYDLMTQPAEYLPYPLNDEDGPECKDCKVHSGFMSLWNSTRNLLLPVLEKTMAEHPGYQLVLTGHSLGGATAGLAALEFRSRGWKPFVTTFGEPRFGNKEMAQYVDKVFAEPLVDGFTMYRRVTHVGDPVPLLPPKEWGWAMHGGEIFISRPALPPSIKDLQHCKGDQDPDCIEGSEASSETFRTLLKLNESLIARPQGLGVIPGLPAEWKLWEILFAHREYFWRLGLCWDPQDRDYPAPPSDDLESDEL